MKNTIDAGSISFYNFDTLELADRTAISWDKSGLSNVYKYWNMLTITRIALTRAYHGRLTDSTLLCHTVQHHQYYDYNSPTSGLTAAFVPGTDVAYVPIRR